MAEAYGTVGATVPEGDDYASGGADVPKAFREFLDSFGTGKGAGKLLVVQSTGAAAWKAMSGDATINADGVFDIGTSKVGEKELSTAGVTTPKIKDEAVTEPKLADDAVTAAKIAAGAVARSELGTTIQTVRVTTGSQAKESAHFVLVTWGTEWPDTNYTVQAILELGLGTATNNIGRVARIEEKTKTQVRLVVENLSNAAFTGTLHVVGIHD